MRLSESLRKRSLRVSKGWILNMFKGAGRRDVLFFGDILTTYISMCRRAGHSSEMGATGKLWMNLVMEHFVPARTRIFPMFFVNRIVRSVWITLGYFDDMQVSRQSDIIRLVTKNEIITRKIGPNKPMVGIYTGMMNVAFRKEVECIRVKQTKRASEYIFKIVGKYTPQPVKDKGLYLRLNRHDGKEELTLKSLLEQGVFKLGKNNRLYFRDTCVMPVENTLFHLISSKAILIEEVSPISYKYFKKIVKRGRSVNERLKLLRSLLNAMGWGDVSIVMHDSSIVFDIKNPPYGLQREQDDWAFIIHTILGYLWTIDRQLKIGSVRSSPSRLRVSYSKD